MKIIIEKFEIKRKCKYLTDLYLKLLEFNI